MELVFNQHGNHVVQKMIQSVHCQQLGELIEVLEGNFFEMSLNQFACRVVQRVLENFQGCKKEKVCSELIQRSLDLTKDPFGIFVMTKMLETCCHVEQQQIM